MQTDENGVPYEIVDYCDLIIKCLPEDPECSVRIEAQKEYCKKDEVQEEVQEQVIHEPVDTSGVGDALTISGGVFLVFAVAFLIVGIFIRKDE